MEALLEAQREGWNIIIVGNWNISVFSPDWVSKHLFDKAEVQVEFPLTPGLSPRYKHRGVIVHLQGESLYVQPQQPDESCMAVAEKKATDILTLLPHTPVAAIGVNFSYVQKEPEEWLRQMFTFDDDVFLERAGFITEVRQISRRLKRGERTVNLILGLSREGTVTFDLNYHTQVSSADAAKAAIADQVIKLQREGKALLADIYSSNSVEVAG